MTKPSDKLSWLLCLSLLVISSSKVEIQYASNQQTAAIPLGRKVDIIVSTPAPTQEIQISEAIVFSTPYREQPSFAEEGIFLEPEEPLLVRPTSTSIPTLEPTASPSAKQIWSHIVAGESGGGWLEGSRLVAWTLRAWQIYKGMPAEMAGPEWGWYGWNDNPGFEARDVVNEVWMQPMEASPFQFMREGKFCYALGSRHDAELWRTKGWYEHPDFVIVHPTYPNYTMNCYFSPP